MEHLSAIKLKRTDTTLDLSQSGKGMLRKENRIRGGDDGVYIVFGGIEECRVGGVKILNSLKSHLEPGYDVAA